MDLWSKFKTPNCKFLEENERKNHPYIGLGNDFLAKISSHRGKKERGKKRERKRRGEKRGGKRKEMEERGREEGRKKKGKGRDDKADVKKI